MTIDNSHLNNAAAYSGGFRASANGPIGGCGATSPLMRVGTTITTSSNMSTA